MNEPRCVALDKQGCRCLRPEHKGDNHDFSYTRWPGEVAEMPNGERVAVDGVKHPDMTRWGLP